MNRPATPSRDRERCVPTAVLRRIVETHAPGEARLDDTTWTKFGRADAILTSLGLVHLWHTDPGLTEVNDWLDSLPDPDERRRQNHREYTARKRADVQARLAALRVEYGVA